MIAVAQLLNLFVFEGDDIAALLSLLEVCVVIVGTLSIIFRLLTPLRADGGGGGGGKIVAAATAAARLEAKYCKSEYLK